MSRLRQRISYEIRHVFSRDGDTLDAPLWLGKPRADRAKHAVRPVPFRRGPVLHHYITNVTESGPAVAARRGPLFARRWDDGQGPALVRGP